MEISVRSYLTAGMAAVVGATAIGLAPTHAAPDLRSVALPAPAVAEITLTGTTVPWESILAVVKALSSGGSLQAGVGSLISSIGTEFAKDALPVITAAAGDVVKYVGSALADLLPQIDFDAIVQAATAAIGAGNLPGAVKALTSALSAPLTQISQVFLTPEFRTFITHEAGTVLGALPEILRAAVQKIVGIDIKPLIDVISGLITKILPAASTPRALSAAAQAAPAVASLAIAPAAASDAAPAAPAEAPEVKVAPEPAPADKSATEAPAAAESAPATEATPEVAPEATDVTETVAPVATPNATSSTAPADDSPAPATRTRAAKPGPRHSSAQSAGSAASSSRG
jgi:hypothetical protein